MCVTAVPGIGFRSQQQQQLRHLPPSPAIIRTHDAGPLSRGCRLALGLGEAAVLNDIAAWWCWNLEALTEESRPPDRDPERSPAVAWHKRQNVIKFGSHISTAGGCSPCTHCLPVRLVRYHTEERERERDRNTLSHTRNAVLPSVLPVCKCAGSLPPYYRHIRTRTRTCTRTAKHQGGADAAWSRLRSSVGKCSVEKPGSGAAGRLPRGAWTLRVWTVAVAVVDQVVFWRLGHTLQSASGCRAGPVASVRKRRRRVPFSGKICRRRAWHRGERWVDGGAAFPRLGLSCLFFLLSLWSCRTETPPDGPGPPPARPGGEWRGRGKSSSKSLSRDLLSKASMLAFSSPVY